MEELINVINEITKYGLRPNVNVEDKEKDLEKFLLKLYLMYLDIKYEFDEADYEDFDKTQFPNIIENVKSNFPGFGLYYIVLDCHKILDEPVNAAGEAVDDLSDIIEDLLQIKWRKENNSDNDAWWYFKLIFYSHTQRHLLNLLNFIKSKNG